ncbi:MAG: hypothetical protein JJE07_07180 [Flavobacteriaceae bacterium]|nr:hypothetical protein [Flavobacteriaceae bacterium]
MKFPNIGYIIIAILAILLFFKGCGKNGSGDTTISNRVEKTTTRIDSSQDFKIKNRTPEKIKIIEYRDRIVKVKDERNLPREERSQVKEVNLYQDTTILDNARIFSYIISEGRVLKKNIIAEIDHKEITTTITKNASGLFISPGLGYSPIFGIEALELNLTYISKNDLGISAGAYYNPMSNHTGFKITLHKRIW